MINSKGCPKNHPIYVVDTEMGSAIFFNYFEPPKSHFVMMKAKGDNREIKEDPEISIEQRS
jgi:ribonuclease HI